MGTSHMAQPDVASVDWKRERERKPPRLKRSTSLRLNDPHFWYEYCKSCPITSSSGFRLTHRRQLGRELNAWSPAYTVNPENVPKTELRCGSALFRWWSTPPPFFPNFGPGHPSPPIGASSRLCVRLCRFFVFSPSGRF